MVILVLHNACLKTRKRLFMLLKILIQIANLDGCRTNYILAYSRQRKAPFTIRTSLFACLQKLRINECALEILALRIILCQLRTIYYKQPPGLAHLRSRQTTTFCLCQRLIHIRNELFQFRRLLNLFSLFSEYRLSVQIYR